VAVADPAPLDPATGYALLQALWQAQDRAALAAGTLALPIDWCLQLARALADGHPQVSRVGLAVAPGVLRCQVAVATPLGVLEATAGVVPERVRIDPAEQQLALRVVEPLRVAGGGALGGLASLLGGSAEALVWRALAAQPGVAVAGDRITVDLARLPRVAALLQRPWLGRPLCHYVRVQACTVTRDGLQARLATGLDA
jgi:hypothetical protein